MTNADNRTARRLPPVNAATWNTFRRIWRAGSAGLPASGVDALHFGRLHRRGLIVLIEDNVVATIRTWASS